MRVTSGFATDDVDLLRFITCGSVDDGKSTLIGRLLYDCQQIPDDQLAAVVSATQTHGTTGNDIDFALLIDGLELERQQGITIDVAYRYFRTQRRAFIVADTPGHEQYTRNMATGASHSDLAIILVDARKGILNQTRRHAFICSLMGIDRVVVAVNKIDLVDFNQSVFERIVGDFQAFAPKLNFNSVAAIPICARHGDNIVENSVNTPWYKGASLVSYLENVETSAFRNDTSFRFPVQRVCRPDSNFRGFAGTIASGNAKKGSLVISAESGKAAKIERIVTADGDLDVAGQGSAVTLVLDSELDIARGDVLSEPECRPALSDQFAAHLVWLGEDDLLPGRSYLMRIGCHWTSANITAIKHKIDVETFQPLAARTLSLNEIGFCNLSTASHIAYDPYEESRTMGAFILVDRVSNATVAAGMIKFGLRRATNIHVEELIVDKNSRALAKHQKPTILWFTGLSGSGKSTIAKRLEKRLHDSGRHTYVLDGDNVRHGLNRDLGFTDVDRVENIRRIGEVAKLFADAGLIVLCSFISPFRAERQMVRELLQDDEFVEIFVDASIDECRRRDPKGLYAKALSGRIQNFTGIDSPYEPPCSPEIHLRSEDTDADQLVDIIWTHLRDTDRI